MHIMKEKTESLWKLCFNDSKEFVEMYFKMRYKNESNIVIESGDEVIAALQMIPYPMSFCGKQISTSYISGACTHPDFRNKGVMRQLLSQAFARMQQSEVLLSTLIPAEPWLFDYYAGMGYAPVFRNSTKEIIVPELAPAKAITVSVIPGFQKDIYSYLNKKLAERPCYIRHSPEDFMVVMADLAVSEGTLFAAKSNRKTEGIAIVYKTEKGIIINELLTENEETEYSLLHAIGQHTGCNRMTQLLPPDEGLPRQTSGMARIINAKKVLQLYASRFPKDEMQIEVSDRQLSANNGYYYLNNGKCMTSAKRLPGSHLALTIGELTEKIFAPPNPYMSLMLN